MANYYDFDELAAKALETRANEDIAALAEWFEQHGQMYWNGRCYAIDDVRDLVPIYEEVDEDDWQIVGWEIQ